MLKALMTAVTVLAGTVLCAQDLKLHTSKPDDEEKKYLYGIVSKAAITDDSSFAWYAENSKYARPAADVVEAIKAGKDKVDIVLFVGTWCHDTQQLLPKYFKSLEAAGFPESKLTIFATDRNKATISNMHNVFAVIDVPTIIVLKEGKEIGRVREFGDTGLPDKELGEIFKKLN